MALIELDNVSKLYGFGDAATVALEEVSFSVEKGEFIAVMGPSGSGKSTLMQIIGLLDHPTHGDYTFQNHLAAKMSRNRLAKLRRDTIGFVFQSYNLIPQMTVLENVSLPLAYKGMTQKRRLMRASDMLLEIGLREREYFMPHQLSGGQSQRVAIARALVNNPSLIIADEPTGNLDSSSSRLIMELLSGLHKLGHTILMVTHNPELTRYASRVVFMRDGMIIADVTSKVGEIPTKARKLYFTPRKTEEDDLAGISELMKAIPGSQKSKSSKSKKTSRRRKTRVFVRKSSAKRSRK